MIEGQVKIGQHIRVPLGRDIFVVGFRVLDQLNLEKIELRGTGLGMVGSSGFSFKSLSASTRSVGALPKIEPALAGAGFSAEASSAGAESTSVPVSSEFFCSDPFTSA